MLVIADYVAYLLRIHLQNISTFYFKVHRPKIKLHMITAALLYRKHFITANNSNNLKVFLKTNMIMMKVNEGLSSDVGRRLNSKHCIQLLLSNALTQRFPKHASEKMAACHKRAQKAWGKLSIAVVLNQQISVVTRGCASTHTLRARVVLLLRATIMERWVVTLRSTTSPTRLANQLKIDQTRS